ncbi:MAG: hypothetical protein IJ200_00010 [Prevotella sp.]|nr:hypothetical protein [Prevotella sp.]
MNEEKTPKGFPLTFNIYADSPEEVEECRMAIIAFIGLHARQGRAVTARKVAQAVSRWDQNPIVKSQIINYFK